MKKSAAADPFAGEAEFNDARVHERQAAINKLVDEGRAIGPAILELQVGLLRGLRRSQRREAERLAKRDGQRQRIAALERRAEQLAVIGDHVDAARMATSRFLDGAGKPGVFHGYVLLASGAPARDHTVRLSGVASGRAKPMTTPTDDSGYFRFDVETETSSARGNTKPAILAENSDPPINFIGAEPIKPAPAEKIGNTSVEVFDPAGRVVYRDPSPPTFGERREPAFRLYPLLGERFRVAPQSEAVQRGDPMK